MSPITRDAAAHWWRPWLAALAFYTALAIVLLWPLVREAAAVVISPGDDSFLNSWILWWNVQEVPLTRAWWNAPAFYPAPGAIAFSELLLGQLPITAPVQAVSGNPALAHNVAVLLSFPLSGLAAHALIYHLTRRHDAALLAGIAFGFGAYRANHIGHIQLLSVYWVPVVLLCLHRSLDAARPLRWQLGASAACVLQVLSNGYTLFQLPLLMAAWALWFPRTMRHRVTTLAALGLALMVLAPVMLGYRTTHDYYGFLRSYEGNRDLSADIISLVQAHGQNVLLGAYIPSSRPAWFPGITMAGLLVTAAVVAFRRRQSIAAALPWYRITLLAVAAVTASAAIAFALFGPLTIGPVSVSQIFKPITVTIVALCAYAASGPRARAFLQARSAVGFYALASVLFFVLSFGPEPRLMGMRVFYLAPYTFLLRLPGYNSIRAPERMALMATLCLVIAMALTYSRWAPALRGRRTVVWVALCAGLVLDGWFRVGVEPLPAPGPSLDWQDTRAVVELPLLLETDVAAMYRSIAYGRPSVNAGSGYWPTHYHMLRDALADADLSVLEGLDADGPLAAVISRRSPEHDRFAAAARAVAGATLMQQSAAWTVYRLPARPHRPPVLGPPVALTRVDARPAAGAADAGAPIVEVRAELRDTVPVSGLRLRLEVVRHLFAREIAVETSVDGTAWQPAWQGLTSATVTRGMLQDPRAVPFVVTFEPRAARLVRVRQSGGRGRQTLTADGLSVH